MKNKNGRRWRIKLAREKAAAAAAPGRLSELPSDLLLNILERVDTVDAVKTCILSKQMLKLPAMLSQLSMDIGSISSSSLGAVIRANRAVADVTDNVLSSRSPEIIISGLRIRFLLMLHDSQNIVKSVGRAMATHKVGAAEFEIITDTDFNMSSPADLVHSGRKFNTFLGVCPDAFAGRTRLWLRNMRFGELDIPNIPNAIFSSRSSHGPTLPLSSIAPPPASFSAVTFSTRLLSNVSPTGDKASCLAASPSIHPYPQGRGGSAATTPLAGQPIDAGCRVLLTTPPVTLHVAERSRSTSRIPTVTSRGGLVLLHQRNWCKMPWEDCLCVYDPMTGSRTFLSGPQEIRNLWLFLTYVLLNATDGIGCTFKLLVVHVNYDEPNKYRIRVQAATSSNANSSSWGPLIFDRHIDLPSSAIEEVRCTVVFRGGAIHFYWLNSHGDEILTYDIDVERLATVKLPPTNSKASQRRLETSPDGRLWLFTADGFMMSLWLRQLQGGGWTREALIDTKESLRLLQPALPLKHMEIKFEELVRGDRSNVVLLRLCFCDNDLIFERIVLDLETKETCRRMTGQNWIASMLLEIDLLSRLQAMEIF